MQTSKADEFDEKFARYRKYLSDEVYLFCSSLNVYRSIQTHKVDHLEELNLTPAFFQITETALLNEIVIWAHKLFDEKADCGLFNFLSFIENNLQWLTAQELVRRRPNLIGTSMPAGLANVDFSLITKHRSDIRCLEALRALKLLRDKYVAHFDKNYFFDPTKLNNEAPIKSAELAEVASLMGKIINNYSIAFDGQLTEWKAINIDDLRHLLNRAKKSSKRMSGKA